jgi:hypothetical protein
MSTAESYVGPWPPEPLLTAPDVAEDVELADSVSMAMLLVLETLTPTERAVFVPREVDGGGIKQAVPRPIVGADKAGRLPDAGLGRISALGSLRPAQVNGHPALILRLDGAVDTVMAVRIDNGLITGFYAVRNPEKLSHTRQETALCR